MTFVKMTDGAVAAVRPEPVHGRGVRTARRSWFDRLTTNGDWSSFSFEFLALRYFEALFQGFPDVDCGVPQLCCVQSIDQVNPVRRWIFASAAAQISVADFEAY